MHLCAAAESSNANPEPSVIADAGFILGTGKLLIKVPPTMRFVMDGEMPEYLLAKDLILQVCCCCCPPP
jgi:aconitase A